MAHCPRCGRGMPYFTSRRKRKDGGAPRFVRGKACPVCGAKTRREHSPLYLRPLRLLMPNRFSYRRCESCGWTGGAFHAPGHRKHRVRRGSHPHGTHGEPSGAPGD